MNLERVCMAGSRHSCSTSLQVVSIVLGCYETGECAYSVVLLEHVEAHLCGWK